MAEGRRMKDCIPPRKNRKKPRGYDTFLCKARHLEEHAFLRLKEWRGIATRYVRHRVPVLSVVCLCRAIRWA